MDADRFVDQIKREMYLSGDEDELAELLGGWDGMGVVA